jgi:hypothetical protein
MVLRCSTRPLGQPELLRWLWVQGWRHRAVACVRIEAGAPQSAMDQVRDVRTSQDQRTEEHTKACESALAVMN